MKFLISITFLVVVVVTGTFAAKSPFTRYMPHFRFCKSKTGTIGVSMDKIVSNFMNGVEEAHIHYCLAACMIKRAKIINRRHDFNMTRITELTKNVPELQTTVYQELFKKLERCSQAVNNRGDVCNLVEFSIKCAILVKH